MTDKRPYIGVGVFVLRGRNVLLGLRKNAHGAGSWSLPGGHLEFGESVETCALREVYEEVGLEICNIRCGPYTNDIFTQENKHYVTLFVLADYVAGEAQLKEPHKCERWKWFAWTNLPEPLFLPLINLQQQNFSPFPEPPYSVQSGKFL